MSSGFENVSKPSSFGCLLLLTSPREFFDRDAPGTPAVWRHLLLVSLAAALLGGFSDALSTSMLGALVLLVNAVGMTCIFTGCVFICMGLVTGRKLSLGRIFSICACASLGPILISWIPGSMWVAEPWKWWVTTIGLSIAAPCGMKKAAGVVACAVCIMYGLFWIVLFNI